MEQFSVQHYLWDGGQFELGPTHRVRATSYREAAERVAGRALVDAGPLDRLAVKVWRFGKAKRESDVVRYWQTIGKS